MCRTRTDLVGHVLDVLFCTWYSTRFIRVVHVLDVPSYISFVVLCMRIRSDPVGWLSFLYMWICFGYTLRTF